MGRVVVLDSGPLWLVVAAPGKPDSDRCRAWLAGVVAGGARVVLPEVADYEARRELLRRGATAGLRRLDTLKGSLEYVRITTAAMLRAAGFWAELRRGGKPTAAPGSLDADAILAGQAATAAGPGDVLTVATTNLRHLARFPGVHARAWDDAGWPGDGS